MDASPSRARRWSLRAGWPCQHKRVRRIGGWMRKEARKAHTGTAALGWTWAGGSVRGSVHRSPASPGLGTASSTPTACIVSRHWQMPALLAGRTSHSFASVGNKGLGWASRNVPMLPGIRDCVTEGYMATGPNKCCIPSPAAAPSRSKP